MIVQETGVAMGWPLGLGHDTTGWPLGLRLRLIEEDLQWPTQPDLTRSSSYTSQDTSSLDTVSTRSFFQDKSISLGTLLGLPIMDHPANGRHQHHQQVQRRTFSGSTSAATASTSASSPVRQPQKIAVNNRVTKSRASLKARNKHGPSISSTNFKNKHHHQSSSASSAGPCSNPSLVSSAGWNLLSFLSCARVPAEIKAQVNEGVIISIPRAQLVTQEANCSCTCRVTVQDLDPELEHKSVDPAPAASVVTRADMQVSKSSLESQQFSSPGRNSNAKLYDNITFEEDDGAHDQDSNHNKTWNSTSSGSADGSPESSKELNPLFASSPLLARDEEDEDEKDAVEKSANSEAMVAAAGHDRSLEQMQLATTCTRAASGLPRSNSGIGSGSKYTSLRSKLSTRWWVPSPRYSLDGRREEQSPQFVEEETMLVNSTASSESDIDYDSQVVCRSDRDLWKATAVSLFISRMVCCQSTPTRGSTF